MLASRIARFIRVSAHRRGAQRVLGRPVHGETCGRSGPLSPLCHPRPHISGPILLQVKLLQGSIQYIVADTQGLEAVRVQGW